MTKPKAPPKPPADDPTPRAVRARVLADAAMRGDTVAAEAADVPVRTLRWWRHELANDHELDRLYAVHLKHLASKWQPAIARLVNAAATKLVEKIEADQVDALDLVGILRTSGEILVTHGALAPEEDPDAGHAGSRAGEEANARPPAPETKH
jgi:hypothetical protein